MSCNCNNSLMENGLKTEGIKSFLEEHKVPICVSGAAILGVFLYKKFGS